MPGTTSLSFDNTELTATALLHGDRVRNGLHRNLPLLAGFEKGGMQSKDGGEKWVHGLETAEHSSATRMQTGFEPVNLAVSRIFDPFVYNPASVVYPVVISEEELDTNNGKAQIFDILTRRVESSMNRAKRNLVEQLLAGGVAGFGDWGTLNGVDNASGYLEEDAVGSQGNSVGGLSKSTLSAVPAMQNQRYDIAGSASANARTGVTDIVVQIGRYLEGDPKGRIALATPAFGRNLARIMQPFYRYAKEETAEVAAAVTQVGGVEVFISNYLPTTGATTTADPISFMLIDSNAIYPCWRKAKTDGYFGISDFKDHGGDRLVRRAFIHVAGQLIAEAFNTSAIAIDGETF